MIKFVHSTWWMKVLLPKVTWTIPTRDKTVYLTFDDGPHPQITPWVMDQLEMANAKASFFLIGENITKYPEVFSTLKKSDHSIGNHTYNHLNAWTTPNRTYLENVDKCDQLHPFNLFRPPYGKITRGLRAVIQKTKRIIMWDIITYDFDEGSTAQQCVERIKKHVRPGSIIVFHDSDRAWKRLQRALPETLEYLKSEGYKMEAIK